MFGISMQNSFLKSEALEDEYLAIAKKYNHTEINLFPKLCGLLILALESEMGDFLGQIFMSLDFGESRMGQFFSPYSLCRLLSDLSLGDKKEALSNKPFITLSEPTCGAGGMIIAFAQSMVESGFNPSQQLFVEARDIDPLASMMCFVQLSLLGIPAIIITGNSLTMEENRVMYTATYYLNNWRYKLKKHYLNNNAKKLNIDNFSNTEDGSIITEDDSIEAFIPNQVERGENLILF
jgi:hypothetical protein